MFIFKTKLIFYNQWFKNIFIYVIRSIKNKLKTSEIIFQLHPHQIRKYTQDIEKKTGDENAKYSYKGFLIK